MDHRIGSDEGVLELEPRIAPWCCTNEAARPSAVDAPLRAGFILPSQRWSAPPRAGLEAGRDAGRHEAPGKTRNVVLIVSDGLRWQGSVHPAPRRICFNDKEGGSWLSDEELRKRYWRATPAERREALFPFLWGTVAKQGQIFGNPGARKHRPGVERQGVSYPDSRDEHRISERCHRQQ